MMTWKAITDRYMKTFPFVRFQSKMRNKEGKRNQCKSTIELEWMDNPVRCILKKSHSRVHRNKKMWWY